MKTGKNFTLKEVLELFHDIESAKSKILETDPTFKTSESP